MNGLEHAVLVKFQWTSIFRADFNAVTALAKRQAFSRVTADLRFQFDRLWIAAPQAMHRTTRKKYLRADARSVMNRIFLNIAHKRTGLARRVFMQHDRFLISSRYLSIGPQHTAALYIII